MWFAINYSASQFFRWQSHFILRCFYATGSSTRRRPCILQIARTANWMQDTRSNIHAFGSECAHWSANRSYVSKNWDGRAQKPGNADGVPPGKLGKIRVPGTALQRFPTTGKPQSLLRRWWRQHELGPLHWSIYYWWIQRGRNNYCSSFADTKLMPIAVQLNPLLDSES